MRKFLSLRGVIPVVMCFQVVPLLMFPPQDYSPQTQEWWLPVLLTFLVIIALVQILIRRAQAAWPWYLMSFAQGVSIISRIMMLLPHTTVNNEGTQVFNTAYFVVAMISMVLSAFEIWYNDLPEVRRTLYAS
jgi:hypothetical protein